jgi:hypothetical protein
MRLKDLVNAIGHFPSLNSARLAVAVDYLDYLDTNLYTQPVMQTPLSSIHSLRLEATFERAPFLSWLSNHELAVRDLCLKEIREAEVASASRLVRHIGAKLRYLTLSFRIEDLPGDTFLLSIVDL